MNISTLLNEISLCEGVIQERKLQLRGMEVRQKDRLQQLGEILQLRLDSSNFPLRLQLPNGYEIQVDEAIMEVDYSKLATAMTVCKSENLNHATLMKLLEAVE